MMHSSEEQTAPVESPTDANISWLAAWRLFRSAGSALFAQVALHEQLARVEWREENSRLMQMLFILLLGFAFLLCGMLVVSGGLLALSWTTPYRLVVLLGLSAFFVLATLGAWFRFRALAARSSQSFAATREELAADIALIKSQL